MITMKHAEGAYSAGTTRFEKWQAKVDEQWYRPVLRTQLALFLKSLPPEIAGQYAEEIKNLEETLGVDQQRGGKINGLQSRTVLREPVRPFKGHTEETEL